MADEDDARELLLEKHENLIERLQEMIDYHEERFTASGSDYHREMLARVTGIQAAVIRRNSALYGVSQEEPPC